jgi:5'-deoxynucleotidase YfbR-like HD superfamily hydrolase
VRNRHCLIILLALFFVPSIARTAVAQMTGQHPDITTPMTDEDEARARLTRDMEKKAAKERVAALKSDTDRLLKLSIELKSYVDKSNENVLSVDVVKKAEEIEKLAKSVKDKMKGPN